jgi:hypothetical protein
MADDFQSLARDIGDVPKKTGPFLRQAFEVSSVKIKKGWQSKVDGSPSLPYLKNALDYTITAAGAVGGSQISSEIGFNKNRKQGALGNVSEYGTPTKPGSGYGAAALDENTDDFESGIAKAVADGLKASGL